MILFIAFGLAIGWGLLRRGHLMGFAELSVRRSWLALAALGLQFYPIYFVEARGEGADGTRVLVLIGSYLILLVFIWENRTLPGIWLVGVGLAANLAAMLANGGYMPITRETLTSAGFVKQAATVEIGSHLFASKDILLPASAIRGWILSDIFVIPAPLLIRSVFSVGDLLISMGIFWIIQHAMSQPALAARIWRS